MAGGISIHVYDVSRGVPAGGLRVGIERARRQVPGVGRGRPRRRLRSSDGARRGPFGHRNLRGVFHIGDWYRAQGVAVPSPAFLEDGAVPLRRRRPRAALSPAAQDDAVGLLTFPWRGLTCGIAIAYSCACHLGENRMIARRTVLASAAGARPGRRTPSRSNGRAAPVKIIVTFPPGGASDAAARVIAGPLRTSSARPSSSTTSRAAARPSAPTSCWRPRTTSTR